MGESPSRAGKVFLSYTTDLRVVPPGADASWVDKAVEAIEAMQLTPVHMKHFPSSGLRAADLCADRVRDCDTLVVLVGPRYGSVVPALDISYVEHEFETATQSGLRRLPFLIDDAGLPSPRETESAELQARQAAFKKRVGELHWKVVRSPEALRGDLIHALAADRFGNQASRDTAADVPELLPYRVDRGTQESAVRELVRGSCTPGARAPQLCLVFGPSEEAPEKFSEWVATEAIDGWLRRFGQPATSRSAFIPWSDASSAVAFAREWWGRVADRLDLSPSADPQEMAEELARSGVTSVVLWTQVEASRLIRQEPAVLSEWLEGWSSFAGERGPMVVTLVCIHRTSPGGDAPLGWWQRRTVTRNLDAAVDRVTRSAARLRSAAATHPRLHPLPRLQPVPRDDVDAWVREALPKHFDRATLEREVDTIFQDPKLVTGERIPMRPLARRLSQALGAAWRK